MSRISIKVLETEFQKAEALTMEAINATLGLPTVIEVERIRDMDKIRKYNIPETPGLVINNKVKVYGRVPEFEEIKKWVREEYNAAGAN